MVRRGPGQENKLCKIVSGVLSPLLANILLDDLDHELERRGYRFARYLTHILRLTVNEQKSRVVPANEMTTSVLP